MPEEEAKAEQQRFVILDGVRRAKANFELGRKTVSAQISVDDVLGPAIDIPVESLYSTKDVIEASGSGFSRWRQMFRAVEAGSFPTGDPIPPIVVRRGSNGIHIKDVTIEGQGELERFFQ